MSEKKTKRRNKQKTINKTVNEIIEEHPKLEEYRQTIETLTNDNENFRRMFNVSPISEKPKCKCRVGPYRVGNLCLRFWASKGQQKKVNDEICDACWAIELEQRQIEKLKVERSEQEEIRRFDGQTKKNVHNLAKRVNETTRQEEQSAKEIYCPDGLRVPLTKCERRCPPHKKLACQQFKTERQLI